MHDTIWRLLRPGRPKAEHPDYREASMEAVRQELELELEWSLPDDLRDQFLNAMEIRGRAAEMEKMQAFADGYKMGALLMLGALGDFAPAPALPAILKALEGGGVQ